MNIERMRKAVALWMSIPASQWDMDLYYFLPNHCGCALGHLAIMQHEGWHMEKSVPHQGPEEALTAFYAARKYFDMGSNQVQIFERVGRNPKDISHKQIFFLRLDKMLLDAGIPLSAVYGPEQREDGANGFDDTENHGEHPVGEDELT